jgi:transcriptional regulator GlxA family with amidase domain
MPDRTSFSGEFQTSLPASESEGFSNEASFADLLRPASLGTTASRPSYARGGLPPKALERVRDYVAAHLQGNISNEELAQIAELSTWHFVRAFKQSQGMPPHRYVLHCRVKRTQELIASTKLSLAEVALEAGFSDQSHFIRCFREIVGITPGAYRWSVH